MALFTSDDPEHKRWRETVLDVRLAFSFYGREEDIPAFYKIVQGMTPVK